MTLAMEALLVHELSHALVRTALAPIESDIIHILLCDNGGLTTYEKTGDAVADTATTAAGPIGEILHHAGADADRIASRILWQPWSLLMMARKFAPEDHDVLQRAHDEDPKNYRYAVRMAVLLIQTFNGDGAITYAAKEVDREMDGNETGVLMANVGDLGRRLRATELVPMVKEYLGNSELFDSAVACEGVLFKFTPPRGGHQTGKNLYGMLSWRPQGLPDEFNQSFVGYDNDRL